MFNKKSRNLNSYSLFALIALPMMALGQQPAQVEEDASALDEITVTAQKRAQNLQDVPIAITAFSPADVAAKGISSVAEIGEFTPNLGIDSTSSFSGSTQVLSAFIRGIGQSDFAFNLDPGVGVYVDGVYYARTIGSVIDLLDIDHIEVLKGPQGTLFGRNTIGGAISVVTREPSDKFNAQAEVTLGSYDRTDARGVVDIPLVADKLLAQVAFSVKNRAGYFEQRTWPGSYVTDEDEYTRPDSTTYPEAGGENNQTARAKLVWFASDSAKVTLTGDYTHVDEQPTPSVLLEVNNGLLDVYNACITTPAADLAAGPLNLICNSPRNSVGGEIAPLGGSNVDSDPYNNHLVFDNSLRSNSIDFAHATGAGYSKVDVWGASIIADFDFTEHVALKSISAFRSLDSKFGMDVDGTPVAMGDHAFAMDQNQYSQEFQLTGTSFEDKLEWVFGLYGFHEEGNLTDYVHFAGGLLQIDGPNEFETDAYAAFAQLNYEISPKWALVLGGRYTQEDKEFFGAQRDLNSLAFKLGFPLALHPDPTDTTLYFPAVLNTRSFNNFSSKFGVDFRVTDDVLTYLSFSEGFKSGGWTTRATVPILVAPEFDPEEARTYEFGFKADFLENRLQTNAAVFYTDYSDLQVTVYSGISPVTENAAQSEIKGLELEVKALVTDRFSLSATLGFIDAKYSELEPGTNLQEDFLFLNTPEESASLSVDYTIPAGGYEVVLHGDYSYRSEVANDAENTPELMADPVSLLGAAITVQPDENNWRVAAGVRNATDERYIVSGQNQSGIGYIGGTYSRPREWYLTFGYKF